MKLTSALSAVLTVSWYGLAMVLALTVCLAIASPMIDLGGNGQLGVPVALSFDEQALHLAAPSLGITTAKLTKATGTLQFEAPSRGTLVAPLLTVIAMMATALWVIAQLRALFRNLRERHPFAPGNALRVQRVGWAVILVEPLRAAMIYQANAFAASHFVADGVRFTRSLDFNLGTIFAGLAILVIAEVFRAGTRLDEDQSLTI